MAFKVSNESKVGALAAIAITFLVLGYNYLAGQGSFFSKKYMLSVELDEVSKISTSTPVHLNGYKVGNVSDVELVDPKGKFRVYFVINENIFIPEGSSVKVTQEIMGGKILNLIMNKNQPKKAINGENLKHIQDTTIIESLSNVLKPLNAKINSIVNSLDSLLSQGELNQSLVNLNKSLKSFTKTSDNAALLIEQNMPKITSLISNAESITNNLKNNNEKINLIISNVKEGTDQLAALELKKTVDKANQTLSDLSLIMDKINIGQGTLGMLVNDKALYDSLNQTSADLDRLIKDIRKNPAKYFPIPGTKKQRKNAMKGADND